MSLNMIIMIMKTYADVCSYIFPFPEWYAPLTCLILYANGFSKLSKLGRCHLLEGNQGLGPTALVNEDCKDYQNIGDTMVDSKLK